MELSKNDRIELRCLVEEAFINLCEDYDEVQEILAREELDLGERKELHCTLEEIEARIMKVRYLMGKLEELPRNPNVVLKKQANNNKRKKGKR